MLWAAVRFPACEVVQAGCSLALKTPVARDPGRDACQRADNLVSDRRPQSDPDRGNFGGDGHGYHVR